MQPQSDTNLPQDELGQRTRMKPSRHDGNKPGDTTTDAEQEVISAAKSPPDEVVYENYLEVLTSVADGFVNLVSKSRDEMNWYQEKSIEANGIAQRLGGSANSGSLPSSPAQHLVNRELKNALEKADYVERLNAEHSQLRNDLMDKEKEISERNTQLTIGAVVYIAGVIACAATGADFVVALFWPIIAIVVIGAGILFLGQG